MKKILLVIVCVLFSAPALGTTIKRGPGSNFSLNQTNVMLQPTWPSDSRYGTSCTTGPPGYINDRSGGDVSYCNNFSYSDSFPYSDELIRTLTYNIKNAINIADSADNSPQTNYVENPWEHAFKFNIESSYKDGQTTGAWVERNYDTSPKIFSMVLEAPSEGGRDSNPIEVDDIATFALGGGLTVKASVMGICTEGDHGTNGTEGADAYDHSWCTKDATTYGSRPFTHSRCSGTGAVCSAQTTNKTVWFSALSTQLDGSALCGLSHGPNGGDASSDLNCPTTLSQVDVADAITFTNVSGSTSSQPTGVVATTFSRNVKGWRVQQDLWTNEENTYRGYKWGSIFNSQSILSYGFRGVLIASDGQQTATELDVQNGRVRHRIERTGKVELPEGNEVIGTTHALYLDSTDDDDASTACADALCGIALRTVTEIDAVDDSFIGTTTGHQYEFTVKDDGSPSSVSYGSHTANLFSVSMGQHASIKPNFTGFYFPAPTGYNNKSTGTHNFKWFSFADQNASNGTCGAACGFTQSNHQLLVVADQGSAGKAGNFWFQDDDGVTSGGHIMIGDPAIHIAANDTANTLEVHYGDDNSDPSSGGYTHLMVLAATGSADPTSGTPVPCGGSSKPTLYFRTGTVELWMCHGTDSWTKVGP